ncbi:hypothetical protein QC760_010171 [Botrytis cinerea]
MLSEEKKQFFLAYQMRELHIQKQVESRWRRASQMISLHHFLSEMNIEGSGSIPQCLPVRHILEFLTTMDIIHIRLPPVHQFTTSYHHEETQNLHLSDYLLPHHQFNHPVGFASGESLITMSQYLALTSI